MSWINTHQWADRGHSLGFRVRITRISAIAAESQSDDKDKIMFSELETCQDANTHLFLDVSTLSYVKARNHGALPPGDQYSNDPAVAYLSLDLVSTRQRLKHSDSVVCLLLSPAALRDSSESGEGLRGVNTETSDQWLCSVKLQRLGCC